MVQQTTLCYNLTNLLKIVVCNKEIQKGIYAKHISKNESQEYNNLPQQEYIAMSNVIKKHNMSSEYSRYIDRYEHTYRYKYISKS